jgi:hypothetical protein
MHTCPSRASAEHADGGNQGWGVGRHGVVVITGTETRRREPAAADAAVAIPPAAALHVDQTTWRALASARRAQHAWSSGLLGDGPQSSLQRMADVGLRPRAAFRASAVQHSFVARAPAAGAALARLDAKRRQGLWMLVTQHHPAVNGSPGLGNRLWQLLSGWCFGPPWPGTFWAFERAADC